MALDAWTAAAGITEGNLFRPVNKGGRITATSIDDKGIAACVKTWAAHCGFENLAAHDLRRSYAKLAHKGRAALEQIQLSLGHSSIATTERYLGCEQNLQDAPCDHLDLRINIAA
jgi:integrase